MPKFIAYTCVNQLSTNCHPIVNQLSLIVNQLSTKCQLIVNKLLMFKFHKFISYFLIISFVNCLTVQCTLVLHSVYLYCTLYTCTVHCTLVLYTVHLFCTLYIWTVHCTIVQYTVQCNFNRMQPYSYVTHEFLSSFLLKMPIFCSKFQNFGGL